MDGTNPMTGLETPHLPITPSPQPPADELIEVSQHMWDSIVYHLSALEGVYNTLNQNREMLKARHSDLADAHYRLVNSNPKTAAQEPKIPDPPLYDGDRKEELLVWLAKCEMKFEGNPSQFVDLLAKLLYVGTRLEGTAFTWFQTLMKKWTSDLPWNTLTFPLNSNHGRPSPMPSQWSSETPTSLRLPKER
jgi:hypothetical protein